MTLGPVRVMGAGMVVMMCVEEVMCDPYCIILLNNISYNVYCIFDFIIAYIQYVMLHSMDKLIVVVD